MESSSFSQIKMNELRTFNWRSFKSEELKRGFLRAISLLGDSGISDMNRLYKWKKIKTDMTRSFTTAKVKINNQAMPLEPNISSVFQKSRDYDYLSLLWKSWRDSSGKNFKKFYPEYVALSNEATKEYGFKDYGEFSRSSFELPDFPEELDKIFLKIEKLYRLLHAYVKKQLIKIYPDKLNRNAGPLPAHILGDVWAQQWHNVFDDIKPYKNKTLLDVTPNMLAQVGIFYAPKNYSSLFILIIFPVSKNLTVRDMFVIAEEFFVSLGLDPMPNNFWQKSIFEKPNDGREMNCHASAWDFYDGKDFRFF